MKITDTLKQYALITIGCALYALGFCWCCLPVHLSIGGVTGVAQVLNVFFPALPVGTLTLVMNIPLFVLGLKLLGKQVLISSLYAMTVSSLMIDGINSLYQFQPLDPVLAVVYGGMLCGAAFGLMLRQGATTGGTELAARLLKIKVQQLPIGKLCLIIDLVVLFRPVPHRTGLHPSPERRVPSAGRLFSGEPPVLPEPPTGEVRPQGPQPGTLADLPARTAGRC